MNKNYVFVILLSSLVGCASVRNPSVEELDALDNPPQNVVEKIDRFFPAVLDWFNLTEADLRPFGRPLSVREQETARKLGVEYPEDVRVLVVQKLPIPSDPELKREAERYGLGSFFEMGRTMGHVILLKPRVADNASVLVHELVHVSQFDRLGRNAFLRRYIVEMEMMGYARAPMELEAFAKQKEVR